MQKLSLGVYAERDLHESEPFVVFNGLDELFLELFFGRELRQDEVVEAGVRAGQPVVVLGLQHDDQVDFGEASDGAAVAAGRELEEHALVRVVELVQHFPEPDDCGVFLGAVFVLRAGLHLLEVELVDAADQRHGLGAVQQLREERLP